MYRRNVRFAGFFIIFLLNSANPDCAEDEELTRRMKFRKNVLRTTAGRATEPAFRGTRRECRPSQAMSSFFQGMLQAVEGR
jgi:hypothetical protein